MKPSITPEEQQVAQEIAHIVADQEHSMPVLPPDGWEEQEKSETQDLLKVA